MRRKLGGRAGVHPLLLVRRDGSVPPVEGSRQGAVAGRAFRQLQISALLRSAERRAGRPHRRGSRHLLRHVPQRQTPEAGFAVTERKTGIGAKRHGWKGMRDRAGGPRGRGENHPVGIHAVSVRRGAEAGPGGSRRRVPGHRTDGEGAGHHHLFQAGHPDPSAQDHHPPGHPRPHGFFRRDGAGHGRAGRVRAGDQRHGRGAAPHPHDLETAESIPDSHLLFRQQNG